VEREGTAASVDVDIPGDTPPHHLQVVDADTLLEQVVSLLIVDQQDVLTPGYLAEQTVQPLDSHSGIGSQSIEDNPDIFPGLLRHPAVVTGGEKSSAILEEGGERPTHGGGAGATPTRGVEFLTTGHRNWGRRWRPSSPSERVSVLL